MSNDLLFLLINISFIIVILYFCSGLVVSALSMVFVRINFPKNVFNVVSFAVFNIYYIEYILSFSVLSVTYYK